MEPALVHSLPGRLHHTEQMLARYVLRAVFCEILKVGTAAPHASRGYLVVSVLIEQVKAAKSNPLVGLVKEAAVIPVALKHRLGHLCKKYVGVIPDIIRPYPSADVLSLHAVNEVIKIVPPEVVLSYHNVIKFILILIGFLVHSYVEILRLEHRADLAYKVAADLIVYRCGEHTGIVLQPYVVRSRKVELRHYLKSHGAQSFKLGDDLSVTPGALNGKLGMRLVKHSLSKVYYKRVHATLPQLFGVGIPESSVKLQYGKSVGIGAMLTPPRIPLLVPHITAKVDKISPHKILAFAHFIFFLSSVTDYA